ncbi:polysaccharide biosynthesis tyrosine autokinase [Nodosilinea sp. P-1105]|uniref:GumC family protein n=1 Tax=Nodosilinea sp. P-1105 TaxID=2546229 RepID=UPI00146EF210|nr:polysaccharide biosynthesis tyrosine autokinase [Nodosilinea sp. P-1105]NMF83018.1 polysaccharide biosynthesis tyrosine autokinase [Nodosilinea sp. P-1105]
MKSQSLDNQLPSTPAASTPNTNEETLDLGRVFAALRRKALLITAITAAVATLAGVRARLSPPTYSANFEILIQPPTGEAQVATAVANMPPQRSDLDLSLEDQVKILTSPGVMQPVVDQAIAENLAECTSLVPENQIPGLSIDPSERCYRILRNQLHISLTEPASRDSPASRIFSAYAWGKSPQEAQRIADLVSQRFLDHGLETRQRDIQQGIDFLDEKLPDVRAQVDELQIELERLRQNNSIITPESKGSQLTTQINNFETEYQQILIELEGTLNLYESLQRQLATRPQDMAVSPVLSNSSRYQALTQELLSLDNAIAEASSLFLDSSPDLQALKEQRQNLLRLLAREGQNAQQELALQIEELATRERALESTLADLDVDVDALASIARQFTDLERELTIATENLTQLLGRRETLEIEAAQRELPWELITPPTVSVELANLPRDLALGVVLGLLLGIGVALLLDAQKDVLYTPSDLKRVTPVPILGLIPHNEVVERGYDESHLLKLYQPAAAVPGEPRSRLQNGSLPPDGMHAFQEAFRSLVANLQRINADKPLRSLVISAADDQLADSTTAAYLAWAAAEMGNRVLLIDADFRFPHLHDFLGLPNQQGLSNILAGEMELKQVIKRSPVEPNLFSLTAGTTNTDPARLLSTNKMKQFVRKTEDYFDLVIYDAPPFSEYADAALIGAEASGLALVSHLGTVKSAQLEQTLEKMWISKIPLVGLIAKEAAPKLALLPIG